MNAEEIRRTPCLSTPGDARLLETWLREIAFQLAIFNESSEKKELQKEQR